jgi:hypothetical protein
MICGHYFCIQRRHRRAMCVGGFPSRHSRRIAARDMRDGRERRDTRNKGLHVAPVALGLPLAHLSRWLLPISPEQLTEADLALPNLEGVRFESIEPLVSANRPSEPF